MKRKSHTHSRYIFHSMLSSDHFSSLFLSVSVCPTRLNFTSHSSTPPFSHQPSPILTRSSLTLAPLSHSQVVHDSPCFLFFFSFLTHFDFRSSVFPLTLSDFFFLSSLEASHNRALLFMNPLTRDTPATACSHHTCPHIPSLPYSNSKPSFCTGPCSPTWMSKLSWK